MNTVIAYLQILLLVASAYALVVNAAHAGQAITRDYPLKQLTEKVYVIQGPNEAVNKTNKGFRNNPVIVLTRDGVVVVDPGSSVYIGEMIVRKVNELTGKPIVAVFDTHAHGDHWLGNHGIRKHFPKVAIFAHPAMKHRLETGRGEMWVEAINKRTAGAIEGTKVVIPNRTVRNGDELRFGQVTLRVHHNGRAHTDNDIMLEIVEEGVFLFGDNLRLYNLGPFMASIRGNLAALKLGEQIDADLYVPGHGPVGGKENIEVYRVFLRRLKAEVTRHYQDGLSDFEMKPQVIEALSDYHGWSGFDENIGRLINLAYLEVESELF